MPFSWPNQPKRSACPGPMSGLVQDNGQVPRLLTAGGAGRVSHQDFPILDAPEYNEMTPGGEMPWGHDGYHQLAAAERV